MAVLDCSNVTHHAAATYVLAASRTPGAAAALAERNKRREYEASGDGAGHDFVPLAVESYGRMGVEASRFLSALGEIADGRAFGVT
jgi:hypothetical protein